MTEPAFKRDSTRALVAAGRKALINKKRENPFKSRPKDLMSALKIKLFKQLVQPEGHFELSGLTVNLYPAFLA